MDPRLAGAWAKYDRAVHHSKDAESLVSELGIRGPFTYKTTHEELTTVEAVHAFGIESPDDPTLRWGHVVCRVKEINPMGDDLSIVLGDMLNNFRGALDYAAWECVKAGRMPQPVKPQLIQFPIRDDAKEWKSFHNQRVPGISPATLDVIRRHQPFESPGKTRDAIHRHPLWRLSQVGGQEKHRRLIMTGGGLSEIAAVLTPTDFTTLLIRPADDAFILQSGDRLVSAVGLITGPRWKESNMKELHLSWGPTVAPDYVVRDLIADLDREVAAILTEIDGTL